MSQYFFKLSLAVEEGDLEEVKKKINRINDINYLDEEGYSLLAYATQYEHIEIVKFLIEQKADVNIQDAENSKTCLHYCAENGSLDIAEALIENGADPTIKDAYGNEPLWTVAFAAQLKINTSKRQKMFSMIRLFLKHGANKNHKNNSGISPLELAKDVGYQPLVEAFESK